MSSVVESARHHGDAVAIMTRVPKPGATKTRLMTHLTAEQCAQVHGCFLRDTLRACLVAPVDVYVSVAPGGERRLLDEALSGLPSSPIVVEQRGQGLGERQHHVFEDMAAKGYATCIMVGSDIPEVTTALLEQARAALVECDVVLGPSLDGGYYLVGLKAPNGAVFSLAEYGHDQVLNQTLAVLEREGLKWALLPPLQDMDTIEDVRYLLDKAAVEPELEGLESVRFLREALAGSAR